MPVNWVYLRACVNFLYCCFGHNFKHFFLKCTERKTFVTRIVKIVQLCQDLEVSNRIKGALGLSTARLAERVMCVIVCAKPCYQKKMKHSFVHL